MTAIQISTHAQDFTAVRFTGAMLRLAKKKRGDNPRQGKKGKKLFTYTSTGGKAQKRGSQDGESNCSWLWNGRYARRKVAA